VLRCRGQTSSFLLWSSSTVVTTLVDQGTQRRVQSPVTAPPAPFHVECVISALTLIAAVPRRWVPPTRHQRYRSGSAEIMFEPFKHTSWAMTREGCPIQYSVTGSDEVLFVFGSGRDSFEFAFDAGALRTLLRLGPQALDEIEARASQAQPKGAAVEQSG
jgi:hypothetical protein